jgi:hypothetical protein
MTDAIDARTPLRRNLGVALLTLLASGGTLVCCVLPAVMVTLGAGAALAGLVTAVPQLVWLSEHKAAVFGLASALLALSGLLLWRARTLPCPSEPVLASTCNRLRRGSVVLWIVAAACVALGALFAFVLPALG